jgi:hypothetical protein
VRIVRDILSEYHYEKRLPFKANSLRAVRAPSIWATIRNIVNDDLREFLTWYGEILESSVTASVDMARLFGVECSEHIEKDTIEIVVDEEMVPDRETEEEAPDEDPDLEELNEAKGWIRNWVDDPKFEEYPETGIYIMSGIKEAMRVFSKDFSISDISHLRVRIGKNDCPVVVEGDRPKIHQIHVDTQQFTYDTLEAFLELGFWSIRDKSRVKESLKRDYVDATVRLISSWRDKVTDYVENYRFTQGPDDPVMLKDLAAFALCLTAYLDDPLEEITFERISHILSIDQTSIPKDIEEDIRNMSKWTDEMRKIYKSVFSISEDILNKGMAEAYLDLSSLTTRIASVKKVRIDRFGGEKDNFKYDGVTSTGPSTLIIGNDSVTQILSLIRRVSVKITVWEIEDEETPDIIEGIDKLNSSLSGVEWKTLKKSLERLAKASTLAHHEKVNRLCTGILEGCCKDDLERFNKATSQILTQWKSVQGCTEYSFHFLIALRVLLAEDLYIRFTDLYEQILGEESETVEGNLITEMGDIIADL